MRTSGSLSDAPRDNIGVAHARSDYETHGHFSADPLNTVGDRITIPDASLLFSGRFERAGADLILSDDGQKFVVSNYFKGISRAELFSPDGASLSGPVVDALTGHVSYAQAGPTPGAANAIGHVAKLVGSASAIRNGVSIELNIGDNVYKGDVVQSGANSALGLSFVDGTAFSLSSNARMVLNEMVYDPNGSSSSTLLSLVQGTITFVAGQIAKTGNMTVDTPVATMGIRGTAVLVEISADNGPTKFSVLTEPGNVTGSFVLYNKITGAPLGSVSQAGQITIVTPTGAGPPSLSQQIKTLADQQAERDIVRQVFSIAFPTFNLDDSHPKTKFASIGSGVTPYGDDSFYPFPPTVLPGVLKLAAAASTDPIKLADLMLPFFGTPTTPLNTRPVIMVTAASTFQSGGVGNVEDTQSSTPGNKSFSTADHVIISDPNINTAPFFDVAVPYVAGTGKIVSAVGPASAPAGFNLLSLVSIDPATGVVTYDPSTFRFLGANEKAVYLIAFDSQSGPDTVHESLQFTVKGLDDAPVFPAANVTVSVSEIAGRTGFSGPNAHTVLLPFQDFDFSDVASGYSVSVLHATASGVTAGLPHDAAALDAALRSYLTVESVTKSLGSTEGLVTDVFSAPDKAFDYLAAGEKLDLSYTIQVTDAFGAVGTETVTVTVTGSNDAPVLAADLSAVHSTVEHPATTHAPGATQDTASGSLAFTDVDLTDTHHVTATLDSGAVFCPDGTIPATTLAALQAAMTAEIATGVSSGTPNVDNPDSTGTGSGSLTWNFSVPDHLLDFLRDGQTLKLTYDITVTDDSGAITTGASSMQPVTLMVTGTNDAPVFLCATNPPVQNVTTDDHHQTILCPAAGTVRVSDADIGDTLTGSVIGDASVTYNGSATLPCDVDVASLISAGAVTFDSVVTDGGATVLHWVYDPGKVNLDFLEHGDTLTINYTAQVNDGHGDVGSQTLTVTLTDGCAGSVIARDSDSFIFPPNSGQQADASGVQNDPSRQDIASLFQQAGSDVFHQWPADPTAHHQGHHPGEPFVVIAFAPHDISSNEHAHLAANDFIIHPGFG